MKLLDIYEELFQYVSCLLRTAGGTSLTLPQVQGEVLALLEGANAKARAAGLQRQAAELELPMLFFVDDMIARSRLVFAKEWAVESLAKRRGELAGGAMFFGDFGEGTPPRFLTKDLSDPSEEASARLAVYYTCMALGFRGIHDKNPSIIAAYMKQIAPRIGVFRDFDPRSRLAPAAYEFTDSRMLTEPPARKLTLVALVFVFLCLSVLVLYYGLYYKASSDLTDSVDLIIERARESK